MTEDIPSATSEGTVGSILVVDNPSKEHESLERVLTDNGYNVHSAESAGEAIASIGGDPPDLILLDLSTMGTEGIDLCRKLKENPETRQIPIILLSAVADTEDWMTGMKLGAADYLAKPFTTAELLTRVGMCLALSRERESIVLGTDAAQEVNERLELEIAARQRVEDELRANLLRAERSRRAMLSALEDQKRASEEKDRLAVELQQIRTLESVGRLAGGVAHDFNNMLSVILGQVEIVLDQITEGDPAFSGLVAIQRAASRTAELTRQLLAYARLQTSSPEVLDLNNAMAGMLTTLGQPPNEDMEIAMQPGTNLWAIKVDPAQVGQILASLSVDARRVLGSTGKITIETENAVLDQTYCVEHPGSEPGEYVRLRVRHEAGSLDNDALSHIFEPFFTATGVGKGLGLATAYGIIRQNGGFIDASYDDRTTIFSAYLPRHKAVAAAPLKRDTKRSVSTKITTILLVDDEPAVLGMATILLETHGYTVMATSSPHQAIRIAQEHGDEIDLLVTDVVMPEMNGWELARALIASHPRLKCLYMSGYTADVIARNGIVDDEVCFIQKPFSDSQLREKIEEALSQKER